MHEYHDEFAKGSCCFFIMFWLVHGYVCLARRQKPYDAKTSQRLLNLTWQTQPLPLVRKTNWPYDLQAALLSKWVEHSLGIRVRTVKRNIGTLFDHKRPVFFENQGKNTMAVNKHNRIDRVKCSKVPKSLRVGLYCRIYLCLGAWSGNLG